jgi:hypothetical protein
MLNTCSLILFSVEGHSLCQMAYQWSFGSLVGIIYTTVIGVKFLYFGERCMISIILRNLNTVHFQ